MLCSKGQQTETSKQYTLLWPARSISRGASIPSSSTLLTYLTSATLTISYT